MLLCLILICWAVALSVLGNRAERRAEDLKDGHPWMSGGHMKQKLQAEQLHGAAGGVGVAVVIVIVYNLIAGVRP